MMARQVANQQQASQLEMFTLTYRRHWRLRVPLRVCQLRGVRHDGWKSRTLMVRNHGKSAKSGNQKSSCRARAAFLLRIAVVNYKAAARAHGSGRSPRPSRDLEIIRYQKSLEISWKSVDITNLLKSRNWKSVEITWKSGNQ